MTPSQRSKGILGAGLGASLLSAAALTDPLLGAIGGGLTALAAIAQYRARGSDAVPFTPEDWRLDGDAWTLVVPYSRQGRRFPSPAVFMQSSTGALEEVSTGVEVDERRTVLISVGLETPPEMRTGEVRIS